MIADRPLYEDKTRTRLVEEGDVESAFQFVGRGQEISEADAARFGLTVEDGKVVLPGASPAPAEESEMPSAEKPVSEDE